MDKSGLESVLEYPCPLQERDSPVDVRVAFKLSECRELVCFTYSPPEKNVLDSAQRCLSPAALTLNHTSSFSKRRTNTIPEYSWLYGLF